MMDIKKMRELLVKYKQEEIIMRNKKSGKYSVVLNNNVKHAEHGDERLVLFRPTKNDDLFCMDRDRFYSEFECAFNDDKAIEEMIDFLNF